MKAVLKNYRQSPRKVRLIADLIRGKSALRARQELAFAPQRASLAIAKLLDSAIANAEGQGASLEALFVKSITVDKGQVLKRMRPFGRGRAGRIGKAASIVKLELATVSAPAKKKASTAKTARTTKKAATDSASAAK